MVGTTSDIIKTMKLYSALPNLFQDLEDGFSCLVYLEEYTQPLMAGNRFNQLFSFNREQKEQVINSVNPDWIDLTPQLI